MILKEANFEPKHWEDYDTILCPDGEVIDMRELLRAQYRARAALSVFAPTWGGLISKLQFVYTFRVDTQATDGEFIFINPQFTYHLDNTGKVFVMAHELMHCILQHMRRAKTRGDNPEQSNIAADYEVNCTLVDIDFVKAGTITGIGALYNTKYTGWGYEKIYDSNPPQPNNGNMSNNQGQSGNGQSGRGQSGSGNGQSGNGQSNQSGQGQGQSGRGQNSQSRQGQGGGGQGGSGQGGSGQGGKQGVVQPEDCVGPRSLSNVPANAGGMLDKNTGGQIAKAEGYEPGKGGMNDQKWADEAMKAAQKMQGSGKLGALRNKINDICKTNTNWKGILRKVVGQNISPINTRQAYTNKNKLAALDRIAKTDKPEFDSVDYIAAFIDTSGSMSEEDLRLCLREMYTLALAKKPCRILIIQFDDGITDVQIYYNLRMFERDLKIGKLKIKGGGGTNVRPCFDFLRNDRRFRSMRADCCVIFTDGYLDIPKRDPRTMKFLVWCIMNNTSFDLPADNRDTNTKVVFASDTK